MIIYESFLIHPSIHTPVSLQSFVEHYRSIRANDVNFADSFSNLNGALNAAASPSFVGARKSFPTHEINQSTAKENPRQSLTTLR